MTEDRRNLGLLLSLLLILVGVLLQLPRLLHAQPRAERGTQQWTIEWTDYGAGNVRVIDTAGVCLYVYRGGEKGGGHQRVRTDWPLTPGMTYHFYITRKAGLVAWYIGGHDMMAWDDPNPLTGPGHEAFGFDGGDSEVFFDNLVIGPYHP